ncbi:MAG TPA: sulfatase [Vicinamibacteria bacterium]|nr:sulfatase [Vicinamibacteria bacterium]
MSPTSARAVSFAALLGLCALAVRALWVAPLGPPNVVLITVDTLRADALSPYGGHAAGTPATERLAREGLLFENAFCPMPQTRPSHFSILTSKYPRDHGVLNNVTRLETEALTLPEALKAHGYRTAGFVSVKLLDSSSGAAQGLDEFWAPQDGAASTADQTVPRAILFLEREGASASPFFLWLHLFDPHMPYAPPDGFRRLSAEGAPELEAEFSWPRLREMARKRSGELPPEVLAQGKRLYQGEVSFQDFWVGKLLEQLDQRGLTDRTLVVLTADHGECFDHGVFFDHTDCLYEGALRVPLIFRFPGRVAPATRDARLVENIDIAPSILDLLGLRQPGFGGHSLFGQVRRQAVYFERPLYHEEAARNRPQRAEEIRVVAGELVRSVRPELDWLGVRTEAWKFTTLGAQEELYRIDQDPEERHDLGATFPHVAEGLRRDLLGWGSRHPFRLGPQSRINEDLQETLRSLGYVR